MKMKLSFFSRRFQVQNTHLNEIIYYFCFFLLLSYSIISHRMLSADWVYITSLFDNTLSVFDSETLLPIPGSPFPTGGDFATGVAVNPSGTRVYVSNQNSQTIAVFDTTTFTMIPGSPFSTGSSGFPTNMVLSPDGSILYVLMQGPINAYAAFDTSTMTQIPGSPFSTGVNSTMYLALNPSGTRLYLPGKLSNDLAVFDTTTNTPIPGSPFPLQISSPEGISVNPLGTRLYISGFSGILSVIDCTTFLPIPGSPFLAQSSRITANALNSSGSRVYLANYTAEGATVLETTNFTPVANSPFVSGESESFSIALNLDSTRVFISYESIDTNNVFVFDANTLASISGSPLSAGASPQSIAIGPAISPGPPAPTNLTGNQKKNNFAVVFEYYNSLKWRAPALSSDIVAYNVYRNGVLIATISSESTSNHRNVVLLTNLSSDKTYCYQDHNRQKGVPVLYTVKSVNANGNESNPISVVVK